MKKKSTKKAVDVLGNLRSKYSINEEIKCPMVRVIGEVGNELGIIETGKALTFAEENALDLVLVGAANAQGCGTAKVIDFGKFLYEKKKAQAEAKKKHKPIETKEIKLRPNIDVGDYKIKVNRIIDFIDAGKHVKITLQFRGREMATRDVVGNKMFAQILQDVANEVATGGVEYGKDSRGGSVWTKVMSKAAKKQ